MEVHIHSQGMGRKACCLACAGATPQQAAASHMQAPSRSLAVSVGIPPSHSTSHTLLGTPTASLPLPQGGSQPRRFCYAAAELPAAKSFRSLEPVVPSATTSSGGGEKLPRGNPSGASSRRGTAGGERPRSGGSLPHMPVPARRLQQSGGSQDGGASRWGIGTRNFCSNLQHLSGRKACAF